MIEGYGEIDEEEKNSKVRRMLSKLPQGGASGGERSFLCFREIVREREKRERVG